MHKLAKDVEYAIPNGKKHHGSLGIDREVSRVGVAAADENQLLTNVPKTRHQMTYVSLDTMFCGIVQMMWGGLPLP